MRQQSFGSYVKYYLKDISGSSSFNVHKLSLLSKRNRRIIDPLILYCALHNKIDSFNKYSNYKYKEKMEGLNENNFLDERYKEFEFSKIWDCYQNKIHVNEYDNETKAKVRTNILSLIKEKGVSKYRIYKDLNLNPGNINDYLTNNNCKKISLKTSEKIYFYLYNLF